jgi:hypothetical protein
MPIPFYGFSSPKEQIMQLWHPRTSKLLYGLLQRFSFASIYSSFFNIQNARNLRNEEEEFFLWDNDDKIHQQYVPDIFQQKWTRNM